MYMHRTLTVMTLGVKPEKCTLRWLWSNRDRSTWTINIYTKSLTVDLSSGHSRLGLLQLLFIQNFTPEDSSHNVSLILTVPTANVLTFPHDGWLEEVATPTIVSELALVEVHGLARSLVV